jgi:hypothetical protein
MAKRAAAGKGGVVIAQEILALVQGNNAIKGPEVMTALREKFPKTPFNDASCQVAYANARKKLGLTRTVAKRPIGASGPAKKSAYVAATPSAGAAGAVSVDIGLLQAAKSLLQHCNGDSAVAVLALKQIAALQMN